MTTIKHTPAKTFMFYTAPHLTLREITENAPLVNIITTAPHECDPECPGEINRRKLEAAEGLLEAAKNALLWMTAVQNGRVGLRVAVENYEGNN